MEHCLGPRLIVLVFQAWRTHLSSLGDPAGLPLCNTAVSAFKNKSKSGKRKKKRPTQTSKINKNKPQIFLKAKGLLNKTVEIKTVKTDSSSEKMKAHLNGTIKG